MRQLHLAHVHMQHAITVVQGLIGTYTQAWPTDALLIVANAGSIFLIQGVHTPYSMYDLPTHYCTNIFTKVLLFILESFQLSALPAGTSKSNSTFMTNGIVWKAMEKNSTLSYYSLAPLSICLLNWVLAIPLERLVDCKNSTSNVIGGEYVH